MKVLVIGGGGREHALVWKLSQSKNIDKIYAAPGNAGIATLAECIRIKANDIKGLADFADKNKIGLTVVGPELPLVMGIVDQFKDRGLSIFGPTGKAAQLEGSKVFAKKIMQKYRIPTAKGEVFDQAKEAVEYIRTQEMPVVVKADGLAAGKGVMVCRCAEDAISAVDTIMTRRAFGEAGARVIIEECLEGEEVSILAFSDGERAVLLVPSQDHKRAYDKDKGPNTGGMGAYSPVPGIGGNLADSIREEIVEPLIRGMTKEGCSYQGILYAGLMLTVEGAKVLEFNVRFGDPETQVILPRMDSDLLTPLLHSISGDLDEDDVRWRKDAAVCVVIASGGYPGKYNKGYPIKGLEKVDKALVFHAGTKKENGKVVTNGGRVLGIAATGKDVEQAAADCYREAAKIRFKNMQYRKDIGAKARRKHETVS